MIHADLSNEASSQTERTKNDPSPPIGSEPELWIRQTKSNANDGTADQKNLRSNAVIHDQIYGRSILNGSRDSSQRRQACNWKQRTTFLFPQNRCCTQRSRVIQPTTTMHHVSFTHPEGLCPKKLHCPSNNLVSRLLENIRHPCLGPEVFAPRWPSDGRVVSAAAIGRSQTAD